MILTDKEALISMGYRELKSGIWAKPIGYMLLIYIENDCTLTFKFLALDSKIHDWTSEIYECDPIHGLLGFIKAVECYNRTDINPNEQSEYHFITHEDLVKFLDI